MSQVNSDGLQDFSHEENDDDVTLQDLSDDHYEDGQDRDEDIDLAEEVRLAAEDYEDEEESEEDPADDADESDKEDSKSEEDFKTEENARNAERRRLREQRIADEARANSPEFRLVNQLAAMYGTTPDQIMQNLDDNLLRQRAEREGVPVEYLKQMQNLVLKDQLRDQQEQMREFEAWQHRVTSEATAVKNDYPMLTDDEIGQAQNYLLEVMKNVDAPLESAVFAMFGKKIVEGQRKVAENEALAAASGRKAKSIPQAKAGRTEAKQTLTADEIAVAQAFGMSEEEYLANKI